MTWFGLVGVAGLATAVLWVLGVGVTGLLGLLWSSILLAAAWSIAALVGGPQARFLRCAVLWAFIVRAAVAIAIYAAFDMPTSMIGDDASLYDQTAMEIAEAWHAGNNPELSGFSGFRAPGHFYVSAAIYFVFGEEPLLPRLFVAFLGSLIPIVILSVAREVTDETETQRKAVLLAAFLPELVFYSAIHLKDIPITLAFTASIGGLLRLRRGVHFGAAFLFAASLVYLIFLRVQFALAVMVLAGMVLAYYLLLRHLTLGLGAFVLVVLPGLRGFATVTRDVLQVPSLLDDPLGVLLGAWELIGASDAPSTSFYGVFGTEPSLFLLPLGVLYLLSAPFILWVVLDPTEFVNWVGFVIAVVWYPLMPFVVYGAVVSRRRWRGAWTLLGLVGALLSLTALAGGLGSMGRWKLPMLPLLLLYAAEGLRAYRVNAHAVQPMLIGFGAALFAVLSLYIHVKVFPMQWVLLAIGGVLAMFLLVRRTAQ